MTTNPTAGPNRWQIMMRWRSYVIVAALVAGLAGCGPDDGLGRTPLEGKVTANGQPLNGALVRFIPIGSTQGPGASARTGPDGSFVLVDDRGNSGGIVPGTYRVAVSQYLLPDGTPIPEGKSELDFPEARQQMPPRLNSAEASPLEYTVKESGNEDPVIDIPAEMFVVKGKTFAPKARDPAGE